MAINRPYASISDLPASIPVFPLSRAILLPRTQLPLNIFEPRYLAMCDAAVGSHRLVGMIQPRIEDNTGHPPLHMIGGLGRVTQFAESGDGRYLLTLSGVCRFRIIEEMPMAQAFREARVAYDDFAADLFVDEADVDRDSVVEALRTFTKARGLRVDWDEIQRAPTEALINALSMMSPFGPADKQALLEAPDLRTRAETLVAITEFELAHGGGSPSSLQ